MRIVTEEQKYWDYKEWQEAYAWYYKPLVENNLISHFEYSIANDEAGIYTVTVKYVDARGLGDDLGNRSRTPPEPTQLPPHIKADYIITLTTPTINDALEIINNHKEYWPGVNMDNLSISQNKDEEAVSVLVFSNYEADIEIEPDERELRYYE